MKHGIGRYTSIAFLTAAWSALWGGPSVANVLGGIAVGYTPTALTGPKNRTRIVSPPNLARLLILIGRDLVASTVSVAKEVLTPTDCTNELFLDIGLIPAARDHLLLLTVAVTLTPGTAVVDVDPDRGSLRLHVLHADRAEAAIEHVNQLSHLVTLALPQRMEQT